MKTRLKHKIKYKKTKNNNIEIKMFIQLKFYITAIEI